MTESQKGRKAGTIGKRKRPESRNNRKALLTARTTQKVGTSKMTAAPVQYIDRTKYPAFLGDVTEFAERIMKTFGIHGFFSFASFLDDSVRYTYGTLSVR